MLNQNKASQPEHHESNAAAACTAVSPSEGSLNHDQTSLPVCTSGSRAAMRNGSRMWLVEGILDQAACEYFP